MASHNNCFDSMTKCNSYYLSGKNFLRGAAWAHRTGIPGARENTETLRLPFRDDWQKLRHGGQRSGFPLHFEPEHSVSFS